MAPPRHDIRPSLARDGKNRKRNNVRIRLVVRILLSFVGLLLAAVSWAQFRWVSSWRELMDSQIQQTAVSIPHIVTQHSHSQEPLYFHFIHTTAERDFHGRSLRAVESVFHHHPGRNEAHVIVHVPRDDSLTSDLTDRPFRPLMELGYNVTVRPFRLSTLIAEAVAAGKRFGRDTTTIDEAAANQWLKTKVLPNFMKQFWFMDVSDLVRFLTLYIYGGVYMDTDVLLTRPIDRRLLRNNVGFEGEAKNAVANGGRRVASGVMVILDPGNSFVAECANEYFTHYVSNTKLWGIMGPKLVRRVFERNYFHCKAPHPPKTLGAVSSTASMADSSIISLQKLNSDPSCPVVALWNDAFSPDTDSCFVKNPNSLSHKQWIIQERSFFVHTYNQRINYAIQTQNLTIVTGSGETLCDWLYSSWCVLCDLDVWKDKH